MGPTKMVHWWCHSRLKYLHLHRCVRYKWICSEDGVRFQLDPSHHFAIVLGPCIMSVMLRRTSCIMFGTGLNERLDVRKPLFDITRSIAAITVSIGSSMTSNSIGSADFSRALLHPELAQRRQNSKMPSPQKPVSVEICACNAVGMPLVESNLNNQLNLKPSQSPWHDTSRGTTGGY